MRGKGVDIEGLHIAARLGGRNSVDRSASLSERVGLLASKHFSLVVHDGSGHADAHGVSRLAGIGGISDEKAAVASLTPEVDVIEREAEVDVAAHTGLTAKLVQILLSRLVIGTAVVDLKGEHGQDDRTHTPLSACRPVLSKLPHSRPQEASGSLHY